MTLEAVLAVAIGGSIGAILRLWIVSRIVRQPPWGTLLVNGLGSFAFGAAFEAWWGTAPDWLLQGLLLGVCGSLTTFSAFALDTVLLWRAGHRAGACGYVVGTLLLSTGAMMAAFLVFRL